MIGRSSLESKACTWINSLKEHAGFRVSSILAVEGSEEFEGRFGGVDLGQSLVRAVPAQLRQAVLAVGTC